MYHNLPRGASLWRFLFEIDQEFAETARKQACTCGGRLHRANYRRQPRGLDTVPEECKVRFSFCCDRDGCRKRVTPKSVRFLGRRVFVGAMVVLISTMRHGASPRRVRELSKIFEIDRRTIARWEVFWREQFPQSPFWKTARGRLATVVEIVALPLSLLEAFRGDDPVLHWANLLRFLSPITTSGGLRTAVS